MAGLTNIFGGSDDSSSSNDQSNDASGSIVSDLGSTVGLNVDSAQSSYNQDEDGNVSSQDNANSLDFDTSTDGLLGAVSDTMNSSSSDQTSE